MRLPAYTALLNLGENDMHVLGSIRPVCFVLLCTMLVSACSSHPATKDPLTGFYGNRWIVYSDAGMDQFWVDADRTWRGHFHDRGGVDMHGVWTLRDGAVCFTAPDFPRSKEHCDSALPHRHAGDTWASVDDGEEHVSTIRAGRN